MTATTLALSTTSGAGLAAVLDALFFIRVLAHGTSAYWTQLLRHLPQLLSLLVHRLALNACSQGLELIVNVAAVAVCDFCLANCREDSPGRKGKCNIHEALADPKEFNP